MSKFFEALERAERERAARDAERPAEAGRPAGRPVEAPPRLEGGPAPRTVAAPRPAPPVWPVPRLPAAPPPAESLGRLVMHDDPASPAAESLRVVRAKLERSNGGQPIRRLLIASAGPAGGATTIVANLGVALAESERQVLLVDANLRNPDLHAFFAQADVPGLSSYLAGDASLPAIVAKTHVPRVSLVAAGPPAPNPVELLSSGRMRRLLDDAGEQFDLVVLDAPPILRVADASVLAPLVDGILLVVHAGRVTRESVRQARASLGAVQARILGAVLTRPRSPGRTRASA